MKAPTLARSRGLLAAGAAVLVLAAVSTLSVAAAYDGFDRHSKIRAGTACTVPSLPGEVVSVNLNDMQAMMGRSGGGPMMGQNDWRLFRPGMMRVTASPAAVAPGVVSLRVANTGYLKHELVVLALSAGQQIGTRAPGADGKVDEAGSLGEASASCAAGTGGGIAASSLGWVTVSLAPGRYELLCNLPGHYAGGMYTELDVA
jgi:uncharacterized cupredoxin-like copper-binding protein